MKVSNVSIHHAPDMVFADLFFGIEGGLARRRVRMDRYVDIFIDCLQRLDRDAVYTIPDPDSTAYVRLQRNGEEVLVQSYGKTRLPDSPRTLKYSTFRAGILAMLDMYRNQLAETAPKHPENRRLLARLEAIGAG